MSKTHRVFAIVAIVATLLTVVARLTFEPGTLRGWFYVPLYSTNGAFLNLFTVFWLATTTTAAPVVSTFGAVVAGQERHMGWLWVFVVLGLIGVFGPSTFFVLAPYFGIVRPLRAIGVEIEIYLSIALQALPGIAALAYVASVGRGHQVAGTAPAA